MNSKPVFSFRFLIVVFALMVSFGASSQAQVGSATFDGTYDAGPAGMGTVQIVFDVNGAQRSFAADFTGPLLGATDPTLSLTTMLDPSGNATFATMGDAVFGDTTILVKANGDVEWTTNNPPAPYSPFTGTGMFATNDLTSNMNSLTINFVSPAAVPPATGSLNATLTAVVPTLPILALFALVALLLFFGGRALSRRPQRLGSA